jgi:hypothetical protein
MIRVIGDDDLNSTVTVSGTQCGHSLYPLAESNIDEPNN